MFHGGSAAVSWAWCTLCSVPSADLGWAVLKFWGGLARMALAGLPGLPFMYSVMCYLAEFPKRRVEVHQGLLAHA